MPVLQNMGKLLIVSGIIIVVIGAVLMFAGKLNMNWIGKLPGDIYIKKKHFQFYFPLGTSILLSIVLSILFYLISIFLKK